LDRAYLGKTEGSFVRETRAQTFEFYRELVQNLKLWQARPPKLRESPEPEEVPDSPQPNPPPFVAADQREVGEGTDPSQTAHSTLGDPRTGSRGRLS
jgi:hypothetical protein